MTHNDKLSRRGLLEGGARLAGITGLLIAADASAKEEKLVCVDLAAAGSNASLRTSMRFTELSTDAQKTCGTCAFFSADDPTGKCGSCRIFSGPTNPNGYCDSWAAKA